MLISTLVRANRQKPCALITTDECIELLMIKISSSRLSKRYPQIEEYEILESCRVSKGASFRIMENYEFYSFFNSL